MSWLLWRQHRAQLLVAAIVLALFAVVVLTTGVHMAQVYADATRNCPANGACDIVGHLFSGYGAIIDTVHLTIALPAVLGALLGATLVTREIEGATNVLVWTQSVTRRRWLASKVATVHVATLVASAAVSALVTWWSRTPNALDGNRFQGTQFDTQNVAPVAFALFGVALGLATGALLRRTLPALAATVGGFALVRVAIAVYVRPHYLAPTTITVPVDSGGSIPAGSWTLHTNVLDPAGHAVTDRLVVPATCTDQATRTGLASCLDRLGYHHAITYQPAAHYWRFQWTEATVFVGLAIVLTLYATVRTLHHDA